MLLIPLMTKHTLDPIASMVWYQAVEIGLDLDGPIAVELFLEGDRVQPDADGIKRPRKWRNFSQGRRSAKDIPGALNVYDIAERKAPGTSRWFRSPMWRALKGEFTHLLEVEDALAESEAIAAIVFKYELVACGDEDFHDYPSDDRNPRPRFRRLLPKNIARCAKLEGIDLVEAVILLLELGRLSVSSAITKRALDLYKTASPKIAAIPALKANLSEIFDAIDFKYTPSINAQHDDFFAPWYVRMPDLYEQVVDIDALRELALRPYERD
jgi:hypothetical protein